MGERTKKRWSLQSLQGMTLGTLFKVIFRNRFQLEPDYLGRFGFLLATGLYNSVFKMFEERCNGSKIQNTDIENPPILIVGQWRSGTTHLHNLIGMHQDFHCPTLYQTMFPHHFAYTQRIGGRVIDRLSPETRPMDNVALSASASYEDEFALAAMSTISPYMRFLFPMSENNGRAVLDPQQLSPEDLELWKKTFVHFLKKLTFAKGRRVVLKSPPHLGRVGTILEVLPQAKFIHIFRNPYDVYLSSCKLWKAGIAHSHLQRPDEETIDEIILSWHLELFELFERDRSLIPAGSLVDVRFEDLERDPKTCLERIFFTLDLPDFDRFWPVCGAYLDSLKHYRKNKFQLDQETREKVAHRWRRMFDVYGYPV